MKNNYIFNLYNLGKNRTKKVFDIKCRCLPKEDRNEYKLILKTIYGFKKVM